MKPLTLLLESFQCQYVTYKLLLSDLQLSVLYCTVKPITEKTHLSALTIKEHYQFSFYDSLIIASALELDYVVLYSEDMQHGQIIDEQLKITNPFLL